MTLLETPLAMLHIAAAGAADVGDAGVADLALPI